MPAIEKPQILRATAPQAAVTSVVKTLLAWAIRHRSRRNLARLDDHMLRDIGLDRLAARQECAKPFWQD
jgi:uncharacterized protein YjiS (DUF1127 family)